MALRPVHRLLRKRRLGNWELKEHSTGAELGTRDLGTPLWPSAVLSRREREKNPEESVGALAVYQLSETPPEEACLGSPQPTPRRLSTDSGVGWQEQEVTGAGLAPLTGQASPPCLRKSHLVISARQEHPTAHCPGWAGK